MSFLEVEQLYKSFGKTQVLKGVSFSLEKGQVLSVIGPSGGGKTTLFRCLNNLEQPEKGRIVLNGKELFPGAAERSNEGGSAFGLVFQNFNLFPQYNVLKNVVLAMNVRSENLLKKQKLGFFERRKKLAEEKAANCEKARALLDGVGLSDKTESYPCQLSGGQQQRVAIARALALSPEVLCFDEPTSALDPELTGEVLKVIRGLREEGRTMVIVTHEMEFAKRVSDRVIFMYDGAVLASGTPEEVFGSEEKKIQAFLSKIEK